MKSKEEKIKELQDTLESVKQELESLKNEKEVLVWDDIDDIRGFDAECDGTVTDYTQYPNEKKSRHATFETKEQAEACIALAKISQLLPIYNSEDTNFSGVKYTIDNTYNIWETWVDVFLLFNSASIAEKFLKHNRRLIRQAKPLL
jgi:hypothetical protein